MTSYFKQGSRINFNGFKGEVTQITETYKKNVLVVRVREYPKRCPYGRPAMIGLFEYPDGKLEFMSVID